MKLIVVNGQQCRLERMKDGEAVPGSIIGELDGRRVYRVICADGDEFVLRNVRHADLLIAVPSASLAQEYGLVSAIA